MNNIAPDGFASVSLGSVVATPTAPMTPAGLAPETLENLRRYREEEAKKANLNRWIRIERMILLPILALVFLGLFTFKMGQVEGRSMAPLYATGDRLLLLKQYALFSPVKVGDIVVVKLKHGKYAGEEWVKRVVYVQNAQGNASWQPTIHTSRPGTVYLSFWFAEYFRGMKSVPANHILVMGDNFANSTDSRDDDIGPIAPDEIEGKVIKFWPSQNNIESAAF